MRQNLLQNGVIETDVTQYPCIEFLQFPACRSGMLAGQTCIVEVGQQRHQWIAARER